MTHFLSHHQYLPVFPLPSLVLEFLQQVSLEGKSNKILEDGCVSVNASSVKGRPALHSQLVDKGGEPGQQDLSYLLVTVVAGDVEW